MKLYFSIKELDDMDKQVTLSMRALVECGCIIQDQHYLTILRKLIEENKSLREELIKKEFPSEP